jgi:FlaA1/EpsC-like NDP-sugar epimerase
LCAATLPEGGGTYVLDMGEPVKLLDMARELIRLSGFIPDEEIPIVYVGLRPGEKLDEDLVAADETVEPSAVAKVLRVTATTTPGCVLETVAKLERAAFRGEKEDVLVYLRELVPAFERACAEPAVVPRS